MDSASIYRAAIGRDKHEAFAAALEELFEQYPLPEPPKAPLDLLRTVERANALDRARMGVMTRRDYLPMGYLVVPPEQLLAVHALIYG